MKTFIDKFDNIIRLEVASDSHLKVHAFAHIFYEGYVVNSIQVNNIDLNQSAFSCFCRFCANSSLSYLLSKCDYSVSLLHDDELDFEFG